VSERKHLRRYATNRPPVVVLMLVKIKISCKI